MHDEIQDASFHNPSAFALWLRERLRSLLVPRFELHRREAYASQFDESSRVLEATLEGLARLINEHPLKAARVLAALADWRTQYHGTQSAIAQRDRYLVYTQRDHAIPFRPQEDIAYAYMAAQLALVANRLSSQLSHAQMSLITRGILRINRISKEAFERYPTLTPRFVDHDRLMLRVVQHLDAPVNCCPSLHIAYSLYVDNVAQFAIAPYAHLEGEFSAIRASTLRMFNSVLYTKQHSLVDIAFGMLCARIAFEELHEQPFDDLSSSFESLARVHPVPYDLISQIHQEANALYARTGNLADALGIYLSTHGYKTVAAGDDQAMRYFDTDARRIVNV